MLLFPIETFSHLPLLDPCPTVLCVMLPPTNRTDRLLRSWMALVGHVVEQARRGGGAM
jgi:hypothetical protein